MLFMILTIDVFLEDGLENGDQNTLELGDSSIVLGASVLDQTSNGLEDIVGKSGIGGTL